MKKTIFTLLLFGLTLNASSQIEKGSKLLTLNGMYSNINTINGVYRSSLQENMKSLSIGGSYSFIQNNFLFGFGIDFAFERDLKFFKNEILTKLLQKEENTEVTTIILPNIYAGYYQRIFDKLYFTTNIKLGIGVGYYNIASSSTIFDYETNVVSSEYIPISENTILTTVDLQPEFTYFLSKKIGISIYTGGIKYSMSEWNFKNSNFILSFNPNTWLVGLKISI